MSQTSTKPELEQLPTDLYRTKTSNFLRVLAAFMSYALVNMSWLIGAMLLSRSPQPFSPRFLFAFLGASAILIILYSIATTKAEHEAASYGIAQVIKRLLDVVASA